MTVPESSLPDRPHSDRRVLLGVDTGGTYTDAALLDEALIDRGPAAIIAKARRLTSRDDLARGIGAATRAAASPAGAAEAHVTLATDIRAATVEGKRMLVEATATATGRHRLAEPEEEARP
jgi:N-methylhydantoinase A/oxoprolinase/acetone carboxylase beta subunit